MDSTTPDSTIHHGLEGIYFAESGICKVDGINGKLYYRGYPIEQLAEHSTFEEVCYLLLNGKLPTKKELEGFITRLRGERDLPLYLVNFLSTIAKKANPMDTLRTAVSMLSYFDKPQSADAKDTNMQKSINLIAKLSSIVATIGAYNSGTEYVEPDLSLNHAENFLYMLNDKAPDKKAAKLLDTMLILHAEHSSNASTFSTLVTGSTLSDMYSAVTSGIGTLKGPLHGGADEAALKMMRSIGTVGNTEKYIDEALAGKQRIMGFGHRVYKTYDPRAKIIRHQLEEIQSNSTEEVKNLTGIALEAEKLMVEKLGKTHNIWPNVDFFSGPIYLHIGIPENLFTPLFAVSRVPGWCAHMTEYWSNNRLIRPLEKYTGSIDLQYVPIDGRK